MFRKLTLWLMTVAALVTMIASLMILWEVDHRPHCPTEDSCTIDYRDGRFEITEVTP